MLLALGVCKLSNENYQIYIGLGFGFGMKLGPGTVEGGVLILVRVECQPWLEWRGGSNVVPRLFSVLRDPPPPPDLVWLPGNPHSGC